MKNVLPEKLGGGACGWVNSEEHVGETVGEGKVAKVLGLPGRDGDPLGFLQSGMAKRKDEFLYPKNATGLTTVCPRVKSKDNGAPTVDWSVWRDPGDDDDDDTCDPTEALPGRDDVEGKFVPHTCTLPKFADPVCNDGPDQGGDDLTPRKCLATCEWMNRFLIRDCREFEDVQIEIPISRSTGLPPDVAPPTRLQIPTPIDVQNPTDVPPQRIQFDTPLRIDTQANRGSRFLAQLGPSEPIEILIPIQVDTPPDSSPIDDTGLIPPVPDPVEPDPEPNQEEPDPTPDSPTEPDPQPQPEPDPVLLPDPEPTITVTVRRCKTWGERYLCTGHWVPELQQDETAQSVAEYPNCRVCTGDECRCPGPGCRRAPPAPEAGGNDYDPEDTGQDRPAYQSFYREYVGTTERASLPETPDDQLSRFGTEDLCLSLDRERQNQRENECVVAACYGIYPEEHDWRDEKATGQDERCVLRFPHVDNLENTQGNADASSIETLDDEPIANRRPAEENSPWDPVLQTMSFLSGSLSTTLGTTILSPDTVVVRAKTAYTEENTLPNGNYQNATDDTADGTRTGDGRFVTRWIQGLLTGIQEALTPPVVRVRLPAVWERFLPQATETETLPDLTSPENRTLPIDLQLRAGPGLMDSLSGLFQQILTLRDEDIPVVVPLGSRIDFEKRALDWERYKREREERGLEVPDEIETIAARLRDYASQIDQVRSIRAQLPLYLAMIVEKQGEAITRIDDWIRANADRYREILAAQGGREEISDLAKKLTKELNDFDRINTPWCRNEYFTRTLEALNAWIPGWPVPPKGSCTPTEDTLPLICIENEQKDMVFDLTTLAVQPGALVVPSFHVVAIALALPSPPSDPYVDIDPDAVHLPPPWDVAQISWDEMLTPTFEAIGDGPDLPPLPEFDPSSIRPSLERAVELLKKRNLTYAAFWKSVMTSDDLVSMRCRIPTPAGEEESGATRTDAKGRTWTKQDGGTWTSDEGAGLAAKDEDVDLWSRGACAHTEADLLERAMRIVARPGALLPEDLEVTMDRRFPVGTPDTRSDSQNGWAISCDPADTSCAPFWPVFTAPKDGWQIIRGEDDTNADPFDPLRRSLRKEVIDDDGRYRTIDGDPLPYRPDPDAVYPSFDRKPPVDL